MRRFLGIKAKASKQPLATHDSSEPAPEPWQPPSAATVDAVARSDASTSTSGAAYAADTLPATQTYDRAGTSHPPWSTMTRASQHHQHHDSSLNAAPSSGRPLAPASSSPRDQSTGLFRRSSLASLQSNPSPPVPPKDRRTVRVSLGSVVAPAASTDKAQHQDQGPSRRGHPHSVIPGGPSADSGSGATANHAAPTSTSTSTSAPASASTIISTTTNNSRVSIANTLPVRSNSVASTNAPTPTLGQERTTSPLSISPSSITAHSHLSFASSNTRLGGASWGVGSAPATWSELANPDLVDNVSARERTRQEILWEVVASEERYVLELRSLVNLYVAPLLHPLLTTTTVPATKTATPSLSFLSSPSPIPTVVSPRPSSSSSTPYRHSASIHAESSSDLPIAARFSRSLHTVSRDHLPEPVTHDTDDASSLSTPRAGSRATQNSANASSAEEKVKNARLSLPDPAASYRGPSSQGIRGRVYSSFGAQSTSSLIGPDAGSSHKPGAVSTTNRNRFSTMSFKNAMASMRSVATPNHETADEAEEVGPAPSLPDALRNVLESVLEMLKGHEVLASSLKEQWAKAFPLVRGLAAIWSDQPWFLETYANYVLSLEEALAIIDGCIPSVHSINKDGPANSSNLGTLTAKFLRRTSSMPSPSTSATVPASASDPANLQRLKRKLMHLEEKATEAGESGLGLCLSKPLMRLGKLPLLMQALLFHTDPTTHEWEKTRAMAIEVDELVRSIEDEKIEEEERSRARDGIARIDGIQDKALMAPRRTRVLIEETIAPVDVEGGPSGGAVMKEKTLMISLGTKGSKGTLGRRKGTMPRGGEEWLVRFSDVTVRCAKVRETDLPFGCGFSKKNEGAKREKKLKKGKVRNLYRFVKVEKWETPEDAEKNLAAWLGRPSQTESATAAIEEAEDADDDAESRMSFRYDADDPRPVSPRVFRASSLPATGATTSGTVGARKVPRQSMTTQSVVAKQSPAIQKHGQRLRVASETLPRLTSPVSRQRWETPTAASQARATPVGSVSTRASSRSPNSTPTSGNARSGRGLTPPATSTKRANSAFATTSSRAGQAATTTSKKQSSNSTTNKVVPLSVSTTSINGLGEREQSTMALYGKYWEAADGEKRVEA
ncbi:BZ3500_MvSof-1268-A1-R1_Chr1-2g01368 [Microbotryum saponariae]|uniref:BZ3500_MvSof-1268-A1-R1_Chr1-2g01368 protein n=1 Tax=Microbotryum saponariae TaxID=289078 RepID=A0A2X0MID1_9BASI|nr:BZ3500_MvSof-1268-A1-R1_Chr1-2g01368 [Microbotryum saponariae]SCZ97224.1 BZ3501_MvSof-1269-A2-R1_Chr1-2g00967 [Microbotryum saponariae]